MAETKRFYTTADASRMCGVFPTTVIKWIKDGRLKASVTPGGHRRIIREDLVRFIRQCGYPMPAELASPQKRILIVDDDPAVCRMLQRAFRDYPHLLRVEALTSGIDALVAMGKNPPDLAILDVVMPVVDGAKLCASLKANPATRGVKIVAITGKRLPEAKQRFIEDNSDAFLRKPLSIPELKAKAAELLGVTLTPVAEALAA